MSLFDVGRLVVKIAGRDAGKKAVVVEVFDNTYVLIDGATRRKKVNILHLEPLAEVLSLNSGASHDDVKKVFTELGINVWETKAKTVSVRLQRQRKTKKRAVNAVGAPVKQNSEEKQKKVRKKIATIEKT